MTTSSITQFFRGINFPGIQSIVVILFSAFMLSGLRGQDSNLLWVGTAKIDITPEKPLVLAGYGGRTRPFESVETRLWARAMVIGKQNPVAMVVIDNCGVTKEITESVRTLLEVKGFRKDRINIAATHTHNAPNLTGYAPILWQGRMTEEQIKDTNEYTQFVIQKMADSVLAARTHAFPAKLSWAQGRVTFGGNRRVIQNERWAGFGFQMDAPVDHSLPVLVVKDKANAVRAVWSNYACHCTTLGSGNFVAGDWAGYANELIELKFRDAVSLVSIGCGADVGPQPSGNSDIAKAHGQKIAAEVQRLVSDDRLVNLSRAPDVQTKTLKLPLETPKPKTYWESLAKTRSFDKELALKMLQAIKDNGKIADEVEYPISIWRFGKKLAIVFMPGEVVVDYAVRLKTELDWQRLWITAWSNRMPGYIPSRKVLIQGGYEADFSQVYYGLPGRYQPRIENLIVEAIRKLAGTDFANPKERLPSPFHKMPSRETISFGLFREAVTSKTIEQKRILLRTKNLIPLARPGFVGMPKGSKRRDSWYDFRGDTVPRAFIRQISPKETISFSATTVSSPASSVLCFTGGLGWVSQPSDRGFEISVSTGDSLAFDVVREPTAWKSRQGSFELLYVPTWTSDEDSAGFFFFVPLKELKAGQTLEFTVQSNSKESQRWFGIDVKQNVERDLKKLGALLDSVELLEQ